MIVEHNGSLFAVYQDGDVLAVWPLDTAFSSTVNFAGVLDTESALSAVKATFTERSVEVEGEAYFIYDNEHHTLIERGDVYFTERDWAGPMSDEDAEYVIRDELVSRGELVDEEEEESAVAAPAPTPQSLICGGCGGSGFIHDAASSICSFCDGTQLLTPDEDKALKSDLWSRRDRVVMVDSIYWQIDDGGGSFFAESPAYPGVELELDFEDSVMEGAPVSDDEIVERITYEVEKLK